MSDTPSSPALPTAQALAAAQLATLGRLAEIGLELAEDLRADVGAHVRATDRERQALEAGGDVWTPLAPLPVFAADIGLTYARITRAIRLTLALQTRILRGLSRPDPGQAGRTSPPGAGSSDGERLDARERLTDHDDLAQLAQLPFEDAIALIRNDLGLPAESAAAETNGDAQVVCLAQPPASWPWQANAPVEPGRPPAAAAEAPSQPP
jgi:hypothetical protein